MTLDDIDAWKREVSTGDTVLGLNDWYERQLGGRAPHYDFVVHWSMPLQGEGPVDVARQALVIHCDPASIATVFIVEDDQGRKFEVDVIDGAGSTFKEVS